MRKNILIGVAQTSSIVGDLDGNWSRMRAMAEKAAAKGVEILCFPEMAWQGYAPDKASLLAESLDSENMQELKQCAKDLGIVMLVGMAERSKGGAPFLSQAVLFPTGEIAVYRKVHLGRGELPYFAAGDSFPVFDWDGVSFAIGICYDWHFPEVAAIYSLKGAEILFAPHASPVAVGDRHEIWLRYLGARAYDNSVYVVACNQTGSNGEGKVFAGGILVLGPKGEVIARNLSDEEELTVVCVQAECLNAIRSKKTDSMRRNFFLADRRKELYKELIELEISD